MNQLSTVRLLYQISYDCILHDIYDMIMQANASKPAECKKHENIKHGPWTIPTLGDGSIYVVQTALLNRVPLCISSSRHCIFLIQINPVITYRYWYHSFVIYYIIFYIARKCKQNLDSLFLPKKRFIWHPFCSFRVDPFHHGVDPSPCSIMQCDINFSSHHFGLQTCLSSHLQKFICKVSKSCETCQKMQWNNYCEILVRYKCIHVIKPKTSETSLILQLQHVKVIPPTVLFQISFTKLGSSITCWDIFALQLPLWSRRHASRDKNLGARVSNLAAFCLTVKTTNICIHTHC